MKITISNKLYISEPTAQIKDWCRENLILPNPNYYKKEKMGFWTGNEPEYLYLYEKTDTYLILPFGCLGTVWKYHPVKDDYTYEICHVRQLKYESGINLYPYQKTAAEKALKAKNGVLVMPCGSGKTQTGLEIIAEVGGRALWLTHTQDLLNQSKQRAESVLDGCEFGTITAGKSHPGKHITFATVQTLSKLDLSEYRDMFDVIICDECQHAAGSPTKVTQFYKVMSELSARYKIGLTATPKRADKLETSMFALLGGIIHEVTREEVKHTTCKINIEIYETGWMPKVPHKDGIDYAKLVDELTHDENRYQMVLEKVNSLKMPTIVLANRVEYLQRMCNDFHGKAICISGQGQSKKAKAERKAALENLNKGEIDCIFSSFTLSKEGLDVPNLRYVVFATPEHDSTTIIQSAGRVGRKADGKEYGTVIDFIDSFDMLRSWCKQRLKYYREIEAEVVNFG